MAVIASNHALGTDVAGAELALILSDPRFKVSVRNRAFLKYIAEAAINGQSQGIKAYSIAVDVFGRNSDFDGDTDPIVRIEAMRLRQSLEHYYLSLGAGHDVHIRLPRGRYIAEFYMRPVEETDTYIKLVATYQKPLRESPPAAVQSPPKSGWARFVTLIRSVIARNPRG
ncbi:hypothetical protein [Rhizobium sp. LjRoot254]|uniref:hypothetical protein n=1 Tax=Rhizobium sp. LjRoot254 TaxID=3342297 RepID=UPI003ECF80B4